MAAELWAEAPSEIGDWVLKNESERRPIWLRLGVALTVAFLRRADHEKRIGASALASRMTTTRTRGAQPREGVAATLERRVELKGATVILYCRCAIAGVGVCLAETVGCVR